MLFDIIVATSLPHSRTKKEAIGVQGRIPWDCPDDLKHFQRISSLTSDDTKRNALIMGRRTWNSLPTRPLPCRMNIVLSKTMADVSDADATFASLDDALTVLYNNPNVESIFVIGGGEVYAAALGRPDVGMIYKSVIHMKCPSNADAFFPTLDTSRFELQHKTHNPNASYHLEYWVQK